MPAARAGPRRTLAVSEVEREVAPAAPGPTLHGRVGDVFEITLVNDGSIGHHPLRSHVLVDAERGAHGVVDVSR